MHVMALVFLFGLGLVGVCLVRSTCFFVRQVPRVMSMHNEICPEKGIRRE